MRQERGLWRFPPTVIKREKHLKVKTHSAVAEQIIFLNFFMVTDVSQLKQMRFSPLAL